MPGVHAATRSNTFLGGAEVCERRLHDAPCIGAARRRAAARPPGRGPGAAAGPGGPAAPAARQLFSLVRYLLLVNIKIQHLFSCVRFTQRQVTLFLVLL